MLWRLSVTVTVCEVVDMRTNAMIRLPAVLAVLKGVDTAVNGPADPKEVPDCTNVIGVLMLIMMLRAWVVVAKLASVTRTVKLLVPATVGVPEITPVLAASVSPVGRGPE